MNKFEYPWKRYALIPELAKRLEGISPQFGKTALQKLVYFLEAIYGVDCGYDFSLYSHGPFDSSLLGDLDLVAHWGCVSVTNATGTLGGYRIEPTDQVDLLREKAVDFLDGERTREALDDLVSTYGGMTARDLELRATTVYVAKGLRDEGEVPEKETVCHHVGQIKPRFSAEEIERAVTELSERGHIELAVADRV